MRPTNLENQSDLLYMKGYFWVIEFPRGLAVNPAVKAILYVEYLRLV